MKKAKSTSAVVAFRPKHPLLERIDQEADFFDVTRAELCNQVFRQRYGMAPFLALDKSPLARRRTAR
jgi:hypothetical protein